MFWFSESICKTQAVFFHTTGRRIILQKKLALTNTAFYDKLVLNRGVVGAGGLHTVCATKFDILKHLFPALYETARLICFLRGG